MRVVRVRRVEMVVERISERGWVRTVEEVEEMEGG